MFHSGPVVNNVLACMTDRIVCATFSADPSVVVEDDEDVKDADSNSSTSISSSVRLAKQSRKAMASASTAGQPNQPESSSSTVPASSLALAAAPLLTSNFAFDSRGVTVLRNFSAPNSRRTSSEQTDLSTSISAQLSLVGDHTNSGALHLFHPGDPSTMATSISVHSLCQSSTAADQVTSVLANHHQTGHRRKPSVSSASSPTSGQNQFNSRFAITSQQDHVADETAIATSYSPVVVKQSDLPVVSSQQFEVDSSVRSAQITPDSTPGRSLSSSRTRINTDDRERFTEEVTV
jgi:hypothetical protein